MLTHSHPSLSPAAHSSKQQFDEYISKTTGKTYAAGRVERELEEVTETVEEFVQLMALAGK